MFFTVVHYHRQLILINNQSSSKKQISPPSTPTLRQWIARQELLSGNENFSRNEILSPWISKDPHWEVGGKEGWSCPNLPVWSSTTTRDSETSPLPPAEFQAWLEAYQNDCSRPRCELDDIHKAGIGSSLNDAVIKFGFCLNQGKVYNPQGEFFWAADASKCTRAVRTLDCYSKPLTRCTEHGTKTIATIENYSETFRPSSTRICSLAATARVQPVWIFGQLALYILRPNTLMQQRLANATADLINLFNLAPDAAKYHGHHLAMHVRRGNPDGGRVPVPFDHYAFLARAMVASYRKVSWSVNHVYLSGDNINSNVDVHSLNADPSLGFLYTTQLAIDTGPGEQEFAADAHPEYKESLVTEYFIDLMMNVDALAFIGVHSNIWALVYSMRVATNNDNSCMFDTHQTPFQFTCDYCDPNFWAPGFGLTCSVDKSINKHS